MDLLIFQKINGLAGKAVCLDGLGIFFAEYFGYALVFILFLFLLKDCKKYWQLTAKALAAAIFARIIVELVRFVWEKPRPFLENNVNLLVSHEASGSFPSGHASFFFALGTVVFLHNKKLGILFLTSSFLIGISRIFVGVHWPSDILVGAILGVLSGWIINRFFSKIKLL
jgi:undecaprenyl-diphosphatase